MDTAFVYRLVGFSVIGIFILGARAYQASAMKAQLTTNPGYALGNIAQALQMNIVEGSPTYHLAHPPTQPLWATLIGLTLHERKFRLEGTFGSFVARMHLHATERYLKVRRVRLFEHYQYDAALTIPNVALTDSFEVWLEPTSEYLETRSELGLATRNTFTNAAGRLHFAGDDPGILQRFQPFADALTSLPYVHLIGRPGELRFVFTEMGLVTSVPRLADIEQLLLAIANAAGAQRAAA